jgi:hypothetical protein
MSFRKVLISILAIILFSSIASIVWIAIIMLLNFDEINFLNYFLIEVLISISLLGSILGIYKLYRNDTDSQHQDEEVL